MPTTRHRCSVVAGGFLSYFMASGCIFSAGILFAEFKAVFQHNSTETALVMALIYLIPELISVVFCPITETIGFSTAAAWGALCMCLSFLSKWRWWCWWAF